MKALTLDDYKNLAIENGSEYLLDYIPKTPRNYINGWKCSVCGEVISKCYSNIKARKRCSCIKCSNNIKGLKDYQEIAQKNKGEYILNTIPETTHIPAIQAWKCNKGHIFDKKYDKVNRGHWCPVCSRSRLHIEHYKEIAEKQEGEYLLDYIPHKSNDKVEGWKCKNGHIFNQSYANIAGGWWCVECSIQARRDAREKCKYILKTGKNKGMQCQHRVVIDGYCQTHKSYIDSRKKYYEEKQRKEEETKEKEEEDQKKEILDLILPFDEKKMRILGTYEEPWFVAKDVAEILGYSGKNQEKAVRKHVEMEDKKIVEDMGVQIGHPVLQPKTVLINESGLYSLILRSKHPGAKKFKIWVTSDVLPSLRKKGSYILSSDMKNQFDTLNKQLRNTEKLLLEANEEKEALIQQKEEELYKANRKYERLKERKTQVKFNPKNCIYLTLNLKEKPADPKFGKSDDINARMATYRTNAPYTKILYLVFVEENDLVEKSLKCILKNNIIPSNHEFLIKMDYMDIVQKIEEIMNFLNLKYKVEEERVEIYNKAVMSDFEDEVEKRV